MRNTSGGHQSFVLLRVGRIGVPISFLALMFMLVQDASVLLVLPVWGFMMVSSFWVTMFHCPSCRAFWAGDEEVGPGRIGRLTAQAFGSSKCRYCERDFR